MMICSLSHLAKVQCLVFAETKVALPGFRVAVAVVEEVVGGWGCCQKLKIHSENLPNCPVWDSLSWRKEKINIL